MLDVRDGEQVAGWLAEVASAFGHVDVLVNNAGGGFRAAFLDVSDKGQDALIRENFASVTSFVRGVVPLMPADGGSIVNITSIEAHRAGPGFAVYSAMKAAQVSLTQSLALELGPKLIRVNCVAPDVIPTPGIGQDMGVRTPLPRAGHVDDVAAAIVFLANPALSGFVTGTTIHVDGGNSGGRRLAPATGRELHDVKFGIALGALNPHFHLDAAAAAEALGYESVWLPEHLVLPVHMSRSPRAGEDHPPIPPTAPVFDAFSYLAFLAGRFPTLRLGTHVYNLGLRHPFVAPRGADAGRRQRRAVRVRHRRELARRGVGRRGPGLPHARSSGRRGARDLQAALDRGRGRAPRRVLLVRRGRVRAEAGATAVAADPGRR